MAIDEMIQALEMVARVNSAVILPLIKQKTGLDVVSHGANYGEIVTVADQKVSKYLLDGGIEGFDGFRSKYQDHSPKKTILSNV